MAQKNNIRSIRFSDELAELINQQIGANFTERFENLVTQCVWTLPGKKEEIRRLDKEINKKREQYREMAEKVTRLRRTLEQLERVINQEMLNWNQKM